MSEPFRFTLPNGIRVIHQQVNRPVAHCGLLIGAGSRDERPEEHGFAHFLEHSYFKGTKKRKTFHILSRLDSVGGEINAFTAKEETWVHASFLDTDYDRALELIADIAFNATFPEHEIVREKEVIIDEINSYKDSPGEMIFEEFDEMVYGSHPIGRSILGSEKSLKGFHRKDLDAFRKRVMTPENLVLSSVGRISGAALKKLAERYFGVHKLHTGSLGRKRPTGYRPRHREVRRDIHQVHFVMGTMAYAYPHKHRPTLTLLNNLLGGPPMNNRLSMNIREKHGIAYQIDSTYAPFTDTGIFSIYLGTEKKNLDRGRNLILKELAKLRDTTLSGSQLKAAQRQMIGQIAMSEDSTAAMMFNAGKSILLFDRMDTLEEVFQKIQSITARELRDVANEVLREERMSTLVYSP